MSSTASERLYHLLPAIYRLRDTAEGEPLRALLATIEAELRAIEADIDTLYDNWFIETCEEWVVPYIADLLGAGGAAGLSAADQRALVANTIATRRRKGSAAALAQVIQDVSGWPARTVENFDRLAATQHIRHPRSGRGGTFDLRDAGAIRRLGGAFDSAAYRPDVRPAGSSRHNLPNVGVFLWRLRSYPLARATPREIAGKPGCYTFSPLGNDAPLFTHPRPHPATPRETDELDYPGPIDPVDFAARIADYYGPERSLLIYLNGHPLPAAALRGGDLSDWSQAPGLYTRALLSGQLDPFPKLQAATPAITVTIGTLAPTVINLNPKPDSLKRLCELLDAAMPLLVNGTKAARVFALSDRLIIVPTTSGAKVECTAAPNDQLSVQALGLAGPAAQEVKCTRSQVLDRRGRCSALRPELSLSSKDHDPATIDLSKLAGQGWSVEDARDALQQALSAVPWAATARVFAIEQQLLVMPGSPDQSLIFLPTATDSMSVYDLGLWVPATIDPRLGRLAFPEGMSPTSVAVSYCYGFSADIGGGPYDRRATLAIADQDTWETTVSGGGRALAEALAHWPAEKQSAIVRIADSDIYDSPRIDLTKRHRLVIEAADGARPCLMGNLEVRGAVHTTLTAELTLNGLLVERINLLHDNLQLIITHCTLKTISGVDNKTFRVTINVSIVGSISLLQERSNLIVQDSVLGNSETPYAISYVSNIPGPSTTIERSTVLGTIRVEELFASEVIFNDPLYITHTQTGYLRFCYVLPGTTTPPRYRCQPDLDQAHALRIKPVFTAQSYGQPGYAQLSPACAVEIRAGAEDGGEMGAFHDLQQTRREAALRACLDEYLPAGMDASVVDVT